MAGGSNSAAKSFICFSSTRSLREAKVWPTAKSSRYRLLIAAFWSSSQFGAAARGSKGRKAQRLQPSVTLDLLTVVVELFAAADPAVAQGPLVNRRRSIAVLQVSTPIANRRQGPLDEAAGAPRPMRSPAPSALRGRRVDCSHISAPNATELARDWTSSCVADVQRTSMLQTRVSQPRVRDFHAVNGYLSPLGARSIALFFSSTV